VITAKQLAGSISGIRHYNERDPTYNEINYPDVISSLDIFKNDPLMFKPGSQYLYSSYGWVLLSAVLEGAIGQSFKQIMESTWNDLGMSNTIFDYPDQIIENVTQFYIYNKSRKRVVAPFDNRSYMYAGGGYLSTAEDLTKMGWKLISDQYLLAVTRKLLTTSLQLENGEKTQYGLGWECGESRLGTSIIYHSGNMTFARCHLVIYPEENIVLAYVANTGQNIFFNEREAHSLAELFVIEKMKIKSENDFFEKIIGDWDIETTSLRNKKSNGSIRLRKNEDGNIVGEITFIRSKKEDNYPIIMTDRSDSSVHLIAVSPMFIDFNLILDSNEFTGQWLHDFNINGQPEEDSYWNPREINGIKINVSNKK